MFEKGRIVYHDHLIFGDNEIDTKNKRPCVVLFSIEQDGKKYVCTCPFTSQVKTFNKKPNLYKFIPEQIYEYKKLSFAKLDSVRFYSERETHATPYILDEQIVDSIIESFYRMKKRNTRIEEIKYYLEYERLFSELEQKEAMRIKKLEKTLKRREAKRF